MGTCFIDRNDQKDRISESTFIGKHENPLTRKTLEIKAKSEETKYILYTFIYNILCPFGVVNSRVHHIMIAFDHFGGVSCWRFIVD